MRLPRWALVAAAAAEEACRFTIPIQVDGSREVHYAAFRFDADAPVEKPTRRDADLTPAMRRLIG